MDVFTVEDLFKEASKHIDKGEYTKAIPYLEDAYKWSFAASDKTRFLALLSNCYRITDSPQKAIDLSRHAQQEGVNFHPDFMTATGLAYLDTGDTENAKIFAQRAEARYKAYGKQNPEDLQLLFRRLGK